VKKLRVLIADDSVIFREVLRGILEADRDIQIVGEAKNGEEAVKLASTTSPDLVTVDIQMPSLNGLHAIEQIMARRPVPILVITSQPTSGGSKIVFEAVRRGALELLEKRSVSFEDAGGKALRNLVRSLARVRVVRLITPQAAKFAPAPSIPKGQLAPPPSAGVRVVAVGASAGGPAAVALLLAALSPKLPACLALVQHLPIGFGLSFAQYLQGLTQLKVRVVKGEVHAVPGEVLLAEDDHHLVALSSNRFASVQSPPVLGYRPAVNALFSSVANFYGAAALGVILTGIGDDGAIGLREMRGAGALTLGQDEKSSAVYGMPRAAFELGAVMHQLPMADMAAQIEHACQMPLRRERVTSVESGKLA
jgi:two-component system, chemotaxis family, protein-glutamate methylesterase/glutaminase